MLLGGNGRENRNDLVEQIRSLGVCHRLFCEKLEGRQACVIVGLSDRPHDCGVRFKTALLHVHDESIDRLAVFAVGQLDIAKVAQHRGGIAEAALSSGAEPGTFK